MHIFTYFSILFDLCFYDVILIETIERLAYFSYLILGNYPLELITEVNK